MSAALSASAIIVSTQHKFAVTNSKGAFLEPIVHLVCGPVGSGKTTYSRNLAAENGAVVFSIDEWMQNLFVSDLPADAGMAKIDFAWFSERVDRCENQIWSVAEQLLKRKARYP